MSAPSPRWPRSSTGSARTSSWSRVEPITHGHVPTKHRHSPPLSGTVGWAPPRQRWWSGTFQSNPGTFLLFQARPAGLGQSEAGGGDGRVLTLQSNPGTFLLIQARPAWLLQGEAGGRDGRVARRGRGASVGAPHGHLRAAALPRDPRAVHCCTITILDTAILIYHYTTILLRSPL